MLAQSFGQMPFEERLRRSTIKITRPDGSWGTGLFVGANTVLTCAHVAGNDGDHVSVTRANNSYPAHVQVALRSARPIPLPDLALIRIEANNVVNETSLPILPARGLVIGDRLSICSFARDLAQADTPQLLASAAQFEGISESYGDRLLRFRGVNVAPGMSGGALVDPQSEQLVGIVDYSLTPVGTGGAAISSETIAHYFADGLTTIDGGPSELEIDKLRRRDEFFELFTGTQLSRMNHRAVFVATDQRTDEGRAFFRQIVEAAAANGSARFIVFGLNDVLAFANPRDAIRFGCAFAGIVVVDYLSLPTPRVAAISAVATEFAANDRIVLVVARPDADSILVGPDVAPRFVRMISKLSALGETFQGLVYDSGAISRAYDSGSASA